MSVFASPYRGDAYFLFSRSLSWQRGRHKKTPAKVFSLPEKISVIGCGYFLGHLSFKAFIYRGAGGREG